MQNVTLVNFNSFILPWFFFNMEISLTRGANLVITYNTLPHTCTHIRIHRAYLSIKKSKTWKGHIPGATEIVSLFALNYIKTFTPIKRFLWEKHTNQEYCTFYIKITPQKTHLEISKENTTCSLEPMKERLAIKDNRCSINYQSDLPYILKNWFNATN